MNIFHDPSFKYIKMGKSKNIITVHDIVVALKEDYTSKKFKKSQFPKLLKAIRKSDHIISVSEFTKNELVKYLPVEPEKITVVHHGIDTEIFKPTEKNKAFIKKYDLPEKYLLFIGNIEKRKNLFNIIKSFEKIIAKEKKLHLVLAGKNGYGGEEIREFINRSSALSNIIQLDYLPNTELPLLYQHAELFFFPSFYEGFGLPILEALACGCPVITSNMASIPEAGGDAVEYVDPFDINDITEKTLNLLNNITLKNELIQKGFIHAAKFSWELCAEQTMDVYKRV